MKPPKKGRVSADTIDLLQRIKSGATGTEMSVAELLRLCMRLGSSLGNRDLLDWARQEANGYESVETLPAYRILDTEVQGDFFGPLGSGLKNAAIPSHLVDKKHRDTLFKAHMLQPVAELETLAATVTDSGTLKSNWNASAVAYYQQKEFYTNGLALAAAWRVLTRFTIAGILDTLRTRVLDFVLTLESELGVNVNELKTETDPLPSPSDKTVTSMVYNTIYGGQNNLAVGNRGDLSQSNTLEVKPGDLQSLESFLKNLGLGDELIEDLRNALEDDSEAEEQPGESTRNWIGRTMIMIGKGGLSLAGNAAGSLVADAILRYLGIK